MKGMDMNFNSALLAMKTKNFENQIIDLIKKMGIYDDCKAMGNTLNLSILYESLKQKGEEYVSQLYDCFIEKGMLEAAEIIKPRVIAQGYGYYGDGQMGHYVIMGQERFDGNLSEVYKMGSHPRGFAIVIYGHYFERSEEERDSLKTEKDNVEIIVAQLGYSIKNVDNLTKEELLTFLKNFVHTYEHIIETLDSLMAIISMDGYEDESDKIMYTADGQQISLETILDFFNISSLSNKPKMIFLQLTRGEESKAIQHDPCLGNRSSIEDALIVSASYLGETYNSGLLNELIKKIARESHQESLMNMLEKISEAMLHVRFEEGLVPLSFQNRCFDKHLFFHPGLHD